MDQIVAKRTAKKTERSFQKTSTKKKMSPEIAPKIDLNAPDVEVEAISAPNVEVAAISPPRMQQVSLKITGTAPYVTNKFSAKAQEKMRSDQAEGSTSRNRKKREPKKFDEIWRDSMHIAEDGWIGIPANSFRQAMISACRVVNFKMTLAKMSLFVLPDGFDQHDGTPLVRIIGTPQKLESFVRLQQTSTDIAARAIFRKWSATVIIEFDADQFRPTDVANLMLRVGRQVGIGAGRPDSRTSSGQGWGTFSLEGLT